MKQIFTIFVVIALRATYLHAGNTTVIFKPSDLRSGPFPSDALTVAAANQKTGRQISLPGTPCTPDFSGGVCGDTAQLNNLDGFSVNPRSMVCFSDAVDPDTLHDGLAFISLDSAAPGTGVNQIYYDPKSQCAFVRPDQILRQQASYLLVVTDAVRDNDNKKIKQSDDFKTCNKQNSTGYCGSLARALQQADKKIGALSGKLIAASLFTTMSATNWLEKARQYVDAHQLPLVLPAGLLTAFTLSDLSRMTWLPQDNSSAPTPTALDIPLSALNSVESVAFGLFLSPNFLNVSGPAAGTISPIPGSDQPVPVPVPGILSVLAGYVPVSFHLFLPSKAKKPDSGFPVVIYGHGLGDSQFGASTFIASTLASKGFATLSIEIMGHGFGPGGTVQVVQKNGAAFTVAAPGRGIAFSPSGPIGSTDGCIAPGAVAVRDCARQSAVDLFALVRTIQITGGLLGTLDPSRISYVGQSFGGTYGSLFHAVEPAVSAAVLNSSGGTSVDVARLAISGRLLGLGYLASVNPALLNVLGGAPPQDYYHDAFHDEYPFRDADPLTGSVPAAPAIQSAFETADWLGMPGDPLAYAQHFQALPLAGVPAKRTLFQFGYGDLEVPNPAESALVRAAGGQASTWFLRIDKAARTHPELLGITSPGVPLPILPHRFLTNPTIFSVPAETSLALAAQQQVAAFLALRSNSDAIPDPNLFLTPPFTSGMGLFEVPASLPEQVNFLQIPK